MLQFGSDSQVWDKVAELSSEDFSNELCSKVWEWMRQQKSEGRPVDPMLYIADNTISEESKEEILELCATNGNLNHVEEYGLRVAREAIRRKALKLNSQVRTALGDKSKPIEGLLSIWEEHARKLLLETQPESVALTGADLVSLVADFDNQELAPIPYGFADLDSMTGGGLHRGELAILAARPSIGKTTCGVSIARYMLKNGYGVLINSLEVAPRQFSELLTHNWGGAQCRLKVVQENRARPRDEEAYLRACEEVRKAPIRFIEEATLPGLRKHVERSMINVPNFRVLIVDYLQLMTNPEVQKNRGSREQEVSSISRGLKAIARDYKIAVLALAQVNRDTARQKDPRPQLHDLRESGAIEQDADLVMFVHRDDYYDEEKNPGKAELLVRKQRNGPTGLINIRYEAGRRRFVCPILREFGES